MLISHPAVLPQLLPAAVMPGSDINEVQCSKYAIHTSARYGDVSLLVPPNGRGRIRIARLLVDKEAYDVWQNTKQ
jgi:hypothetical protein